MNHRNTRYVICIERKDGTSEEIQASSRRVDALNRARFVAHDIIGWPTIVRAWVKDTMPSSMVNVVANYSRFS